jgi:hypothetical protein
VDWLRDVQEGFREPATALLAQFWWVIPLAGLAFWLYFVLEIEPSGRGQPVDDVFDGDGDGGGDGGGD